MDRPPNLPTDLDVRRFEEEVFARFKASVEHLDSELGRKKHPPSLSVREVELVDEFPQTALRVLIEDHVSNELRWKREPLWDVPHFYLEDGSIQSAKRVASDLVTYTYGG